MEEEERVVEEGQYRIRWVRREEEKREAEEVLIFR